VYFGTLAHATALVSDTKIARGGQACHVVVSDTISTRRQLLNFRVHAGTLARSTRPEPGSGFEPGSSVSTVVALFAQSPEGVLANKPSLGAVG
jgi:hypothetical protein